MTQQGLGSGPSAAAAGSAGTSVSLQHLSCPNSRVPGSQAHTAHLPEHASKKWTVTQITPAASFCKSHSYILNTKNIFHVPIFSAFKNNTELQILTRDLLSNLVLGEAVFFDLKLYRARQKTEQLPNFCLFSLFPRRGHSSHRTVCGLSNICFKQFH